MNKISDWRKSKKVRFYVIGGLLAVVFLIGLLFESVRWWMVGVGAVLLIALGLEVANTDIDLGSVMQGNSLSDSVIERDVDGNLQESATGGLLTKIWRDKEGNEVPDGTAEAKSTDEYNCDDFETQPEAQRFFEAAGGVENDVNRLDGNKDGVACQALPAGAN